MAKALAISLLFYPRLKPGVKISGTEHSLAFNFYTQKSTILCYLFYSVKLYPVQIEQSGAFFFAFKFNIKRFNAGCFCSFGAIFMVVSSTL